MTGVPPARPAPIGLPIGTRVAVDEDTVRYRNGSVFGGSPGRLFRLNRSAQAALVELRDGVVRTAAGATLGRRFTDAGVIHPIPAAGPRPELAGSVTVIIPVKDRVLELDRCLTALNAPDADPDGLVAEVIVVDDGSADPAAVAAVARRFGATVLRRERNGGPGPARNSGLERATTPLIAFCDSDCIPPRGWLQALVGHLDDPLVGAAAPRIVARLAHASSGPPALSQRFALARCPLDLGPRPALVAPMTRVSYVPTAALLVRRQALDNLPAPVFDPELRFGEDVDLVWRLIAAQWRIRYDPTVTVGHVEPAGWRAMLRRRAAYGSSAAALADRHPGQLAPLVLVASPAATVAALFARKPVLAVAALALGYAELARTLERAGFDRAALARPLVRGTTETAFGVSRWVSQFALPAALGAAVSPGRSGHPVIGRRVAVAVLLAMAPLREWWRTRPDIDPVRWSTAILADDAAYGVGVWAGSIRRRHLRAILPRFRRNLVRVAGRS